MSATSAQIVHDNTQIDAVKAPQTPSDLKVIKRNGSVSPFDEAKISSAITKAFLAVEGAAASGSEHVHEEAKKLTLLVCQSLSRRTANDRALHIEDVQDQVELVLMREGHQKIARAYILYREERSKERLEQIANEHNTKQSPLMIKTPSGKEKPLDIAYIRGILKDAMEGLVSLEEELPILEANLLHALYSGMSEKEVEKALVMTAKTEVEREPRFSGVTARLLLHKTWHEACDFVLEKTTKLDKKAMEKLYPEYFKAYMKKAVDLELLDPALLKMDLNKLANALQPERDFSFSYLGLQTLYDRYFLQSRSVRFELPQAFFMRVAAGLALNEKKDREEWAIRFYDLLSNFDFMSSTPTLFNSGTLRPQLSSCYLTTVPDHLEGIYNGIRDNALLSKFAGGLGNDWTPVRALGSHIKGTNGQSQGVIPFMKVANDTALAVNQGGKRKGAVCAYLETWHFDIEEFLELRKNTGDDRRRTHDMNTSNWIPDLFMERVIEGKEWTLFSPSDTKDLHDLYGQDFNRKYEEYEAQAKAGKITNYRTIEARSLWRKMLTMLFETGHPWVTFKDPCNLRSPQQHVGVVHSSNLCTEITLNTSEDEIAVCNLGSVNLVQHISEKGLDKEKLKKTVSLAMRMLDNVIDYNFYPVPQAERSNKRHRPVGMGLMGFQDALYKLRCPYGSEQAVTFADESMELLSYYAFSASADLADERGSYESFEGSLWSQGILPIDSIELLRKSRGKYLDQDTTQRLDWDSLRTRIQTKGIRNSNCLAIAPTATIANICGVTSSIEPIYQNLYVKSNLSGEFTVINPYLVEDLKRLNLWDEAMAHDLKYYDGSLAKIKRIPDEIKALYVTAFELDCRWLIEAGSRRQKWIDQAQSLNLYVGNPSGRLLDNIYKLAWLRGLKTTYYLRTIGATHVEKSTLAKADGKLNAVSASLPEEIATLTPVASSSVSSTSDHSESAPDLTNVQFCAIDDPECEACQ